jgi:phage FluMu gp28-like protein
VPFEQQQQILFYIVDRLPKMRAGKLDAGGNGSFLAEVAMQEYGANRIEMVTFSEPWYRENMPKLKAAFEDGAIELPKDRDVLDDFALLRYVRGVIRVPERVLGSDGKGRHGDTAIAGALAWAASLAEPEIYEFESRRPGDSAPGHRWAQTAAERNADDDTRKPGGGFMPALRGGVLADPTGRAL